MTRSVDLNSARHAVETFDLYFNDLFAGKLEITQGMRMAFEYSNRYVEGDGFTPIPISLTMPFDRQRYGDEIVFPFVENLLPEGEIRALIQKAHKIEDGNFLRLLELLGGDVAGALSIQPVGGIPNLEVGESLLPLNREALSQLLIEVQERPFNAQVSDKLGGQGRVGRRLSLAGAQNKLPIIKIDQTFYEAGPTPSTHIIKPARKDGRFGSLVYNEYICMKAAKYAGIDAAEVALLDVWDESGSESDALLIRRYDRVKSGDVIRRIHQEDLCQLCSQPSAMKYQISGGPGFVELFDKVSDYCVMPVRDDIELFRRMMFNLVIGNYDAHAKNFSFLIHHNGSVSLAPAYDLVCTALYDELDQTFAMSIQEASDLHALKRQHFVDLFERINKRYDALAASLIKFSDVAFESVKRSVGEFLQGDYYKSDLESAARLMGIAEDNHQFIRALFL